MKDTFLRLRTAFAELAPRERMMVAAGAAALGILLVYLAVWEPLVQARETRAQALERARQTALQIEAAATQVRSQSAGARVDRSTSLLAAVDQTSRSATLGKAPSRLQPEGDREVRIWFENVGFNNLLRWLQDLETRYGIAVASAEIERGAAPGLVSARLTLTRE